MTPAEIITAIRKLGTVAAVDLLADAWEQVVCDASEDNGDFQALETVRVSALKTFGPKDDLEITPFDVLDTARSQLIAWQDDSENPAVIAAGRDHDEACADYRAGAL